MRIVYFGSSGFSVPTLKALSDQIVCVVTKQGKPKGRGYGLDDNEVKSAATSLNLPVIEIDSFRDDVVKTLPYYRPDLFMVVSFGLIIPRWVLDMPSIGPVNIHPSLLPLYRGPSPMQWAILSGDSITGVTFIKMNDKMDAGDIIYQEQITIQPDEDLYSLSERLADKAADVAGPLVDKIGLQGFIMGITQQHDSATYAPMVTKEMGKIDWVKSADHICRQIQAFVLWPTAYTFLDDKILKIFKATKVETDIDSTPGLIREIRKEGVVIETGDSSLLIKEVQLENKKRMTAYSFAQGYRGLIGRILG